MVMRADGCSQRAVARCLGRSPSTISRELVQHVVLQAVGDRTILPSMHHWPANGLWCCARSHEAQSSLPIRRCSPSC
jgi:hypothetical protein